MRGAGDPFAPLREVPEPRQAAEPGIRGPSTRPTAFGHAGLLHEQGLPGAVDDPAVELLV